MDQNGGPLMLLGAFPIDPDADGPIYYNALDQFLEGWRDHCGPMGGMAWLIGKMAQAGPAGFPWTMKIQPKEKATCLSWSHSPGWTPTPT